MLKIDSSFSSYRPVNSRVGGTPNRPGASLWHLRTWLKNRSDLQCLIWENYWLVI